MAHRLSTVQQVDRIVVLNNGEVAEQGSHLDLLQKQGLYRRFHDNYFAVSRDEPPAIPAGGGSR